MKKPDTESVSRTLAETERLTRVLKQRAEQMHARIDSAHKDAEQLHQRIRNSREQAASTRAKATRTRVSARKQRHKPAA